MTSLQNFCSAGFSAPQAGQFISTTQFVEQRLGVLQVGGVEALGEVRYSWAIEPPLFLRWKRSVMASEVRHLIVRMARPQGSRAAPRPQIHPARRGRAR